LKLKFFKDNQFNSNIMNSIGVDFKLKNVDFEGKLVKMQIVIFVFIYYKINWEKKP